MRMKNVIMNMPIIIQDDDNQHEKHDDQSDNEQVMREEGLEQVTGLSCATGDNQMVSVALSLSFSLSFSLPLSFSLSLS